MCNTWWLVLAVLVAVTVIILLFAFSSWLIEGKDRLDYEDEESDLWT